MKSRPGDLLFGTGANNGRYKGIYHVEMFVGYACYGFQGNKPILTTKWLPEAMAMAAANGLDVRNCFA